MGETIHAPSPITGPKIRECVLRQAKRAGVGHIGSALSVADILAALYNGVLHRQTETHPDRDRFVLAKGHAALALYAALYLRGTLTAEQLNTYCGDETLLGTHPECQLPGVDFATGSLGQGITLAGGAALAARLLRRPSRAFVLQSDAECNEGSVWEAAMFAAHHQLANLIAIIDVNGQQALGHTHDVLNLEPLADKWRAFGWRVHEVDGHDQAALEALLNALDTTAGAPHVVLAKTVAGKGVSYMEGQVKWHYWPMNDEQYAQALAEIGAAP